MNLTCNNEVNQGVSANFSACSEIAVQRPPVIDPFENFYKVAFSSAIFIYTVSLVTILANSLLLLVFCVDPLKIFRNSTTYFFIGLAIVDLLTALVQEPIYATCFILLYIKHPSLQKCEPFMKFASDFSAFSITVSLLIVFAFTVTQCIVVSSPLGDQEESFHQRGLHLSLHCNILLLTTDGCSTKSQGCCRTVPSQLCSCFGHNSFLHPSALHNEKENGDRKYTSERKYIP